MQISDRFHMWQSLSRRAQDIAAAHRSCLPAARPPAEEPDPAPDEETSENTAADTRAGQHSKRLFEAVHTLTDAGRTYSAVARELGLDRRTVRKKRPHERQSHRAVDTREVLKPWFPPPGLRWESRLGT